MSIVVAVKGSTNNLVATLEQLFPVKLMLCEWPVPYIMGVAWRAPLQLDITQLNTDTDTDTF